MLELIFATQNQNKVREIQQLLPPSISVKTLVEMGLIEEIPETHPTIIENAFQKAEYVFTKLGFSCFADDTGLEVEALGGEPGVYSARYAGPEKNSEKNIDLLLYKMKGVQNRKAQFKTVIALILDGKKFSFEGIVEGTIREKRSGTGGFGYDAIFEPEACGRTYAEMTLKEKNHTSHRSRAIQKLVNFLTNMVLIL